MIKPTKKKKKKKDKDKDKSPRTPRGSGSAASTLDGDDSFFSDEPRKLSEPLLL